MKVFDLYSTLLRYPSDFSEFVWGLDELNRYETSHLRACEPGLLQEDYVSSFDFSETSSLLVTSHVASGEGDRNDVLAGFAAFVKLYGSEKVENASPDYLPDILNAFQSALEHEEDKGVVMLMSGLLLKVVERIENSLVTAGSMYSPVMKGLRHELRRVAENTEVGHA